MEDNLYNGVQTLVSVSYTHLIAVAKDAVTKDLPTPPLPLTTPITFLTDEYSFNFS